MSYRIKIGEESKIGEADGIIHENGRPKKKEEEGTRLPRGLCYLEGWQRRRGRSSAYGLVDG